MITLQRCIIRVKISSAAGRSKSRRSWCDTKFGRYQRMRAQLVYYYATREHTINLEQENQFSKKFAFLSCIIQSETIVETSELGLYFLYYFPDTEPVVFQIARIEYERNEKEIWT